MEPCKYTSTLEIIQKADRVPQLKKQTIATKLSTEEGKKGGEEGRELLKREGKKGGEERGERRDEARRRDNPHT